MTLVERYCEFINTTKYAVAIFTRKALYIVPKNSRQSVKKSQIGNLLYVDRVTKISLVDRNKIEDVYDFLISDKDIVLCEPITDKLINKIVKGG